MNSIVEAEVIDAAGQILGRVTRQEVTYFVVEDRLGQSTVVLNDEVATMEAGEIRLRLALSEMERRPARPAPDVEARRPED